MAERLKVLVSAYACSPVRGSEPGVGWGFVKALAKHHDLWILTEQEKFQDEVEVALQDDPVLASRARFYFIQKKRNRALRKIWPPSYYRYYRKWHLKAFLFAQQLHKEVGFDLAHQLTMVGFREPGYLWQLGIPFVWGPIGGMGYFPWRFLLDVGPEGAVYYAGYNCLNFLHSHFLQRPKKAARKAGQGLITATFENKTGALNYWGCCSEVITEVGLPCPVANTTSHRAQGEPLEITWAGFHTPGKALGLALKGLALLGKEVNWVLHVLGAGAKTGNWQHEAQQQGIADRCHFHGWLARQDALTRMQSSHVLLITSLRDLTSTVTIEALALGVPIICLDHCGFSHVVTPECGIKVPVTSPRQVATYIAESIKKIWEDEAWRRDLASGALQRASSFSWDKKASQIDEIYKKVLVSS